MNEYGNMQKGLFWFALGAFCCLTSVAIGAFAAHGLKDLLTVADIQLVETGARYQMYHGIAILCVSVMQLLLGQHFRRESNSTKKKRQTSLLSCNILFILGILCFSGSLYMLSIQRAWFSETEIPTFIFLITPIGGLLFIFAWALLIYKCIREALVE